jgi:hypothetical protein
LFRRTYDLSIAYDKYYRTPRLFLFGYDEVRLDWGLGLDGGDKSKGEAFSGKAGVRFGGRGLT